jgi:hypothetical protein
MAYLWQRNNRMEMGNGRTSSPGSCSFSNATAQHKTDCTPQDLLYAIYSLPFDMQIRIEQNYSNVIYMNFTPFYAARDGEETEWNCQNSTGNCSPRSTAYTSKSSLCGKRGGQSSNIQSDLRLFRL